MSLLKVYQRSVFAESYKAFIFNFKSLLLIAPAGISPGRRNPEEALARILRKVLTVEIYSQYARTISICLNRGREESVGNDYVFYCSRPQVRDG